MATIWIDGNAYEVDGSKNLLQACLELGFDLPYFCWHPALKSVGACRQCAVKQFKDEEDTEGKIVMACMTPAADGTRISIVDEEAATFRARVIEWLMENHPHDCPVCDEGGECHLQDMTVMTGHNYRRFSFDKRTYRNQYLGPFVNHEMNRCIQCYRCVRFYREYAGGEDLEAFGAHDHVYFGRHEEGVLESEFSGNLVEVCPTGVFTDKTLKEHYTRKWDLQTAPSVCVHCGLGCNTIPGERANMLRRIRARYSNEVNGYFLCDRGRYGYAFVNHDRRLRQPLLPEGKEQAARTIGREEVSRQFRQMTGNGGRLLGIGSPRASVEANFALRQLVGEEQFSCGMSQADHDLMNSILAVMREGSSPVLSLREVEQCDAVLVLGEDATQTAPMLALALRQETGNRAEKAAEELQVAPWHDASVRTVLAEQRSPLFVLTPNATKLDGIAQRAVRAVPEDIARMGFAIAHQLDSQAPAVEDIDDENRELAEEIAAALSQAERPLVVSGTSAGSTAVIEAAANVAWSVGRGADRSPAGLFFVVPECNSLGVAMLGGMSLDRAIDELKPQPGDTIVILENDLYRRTDRQRVDKFLSSNAKVVMIDHLATDTAAAADLVLPAATFAEQTGTLINNEGRAQRFVQVFVPDGEIQAAWRWVRDMAVAGSRETVPRWDDLDSVMRSLADGVPVFARLPEASARADDPAVHARIPRQAHRYSGRTALHADRTVREPKPAPDPDAPMTFSMEGYILQPNTPLLARYWYPGWNSVQALNRFQEEIDGPLRDGASGVRLVEPSGDGGRAYFTSVPEPFRAEQDRIRALRLYHIFGSEELSVLSPGIAELAPEAYVALNEQMAETLGVGNGDSVLVNCDGQTARLPVRVDEAIPSGAAGLPVGLADQPFVSVPDWIRIESS